MIRAHALAAVLLLAAAACRPTPEVGPATAAAAISSDREPTLTPAPELHGMSTRAFTSVSPDRRWRAEAQLANFPGEDPYEYERVTLTRTDLSVFWVAHERLVESGGLGWGYLSEFTWSADGSSLYFSHTAASDGCGYPFTTELHHVDLAAQ